MAHGDTAGFQVEGSDLPLPAPSPPAHPCNVEQDFAKVIPYVYDGKLLTAELTFQIFSSPACDFQTAAATFDDSKKLIQLVDGHAPGPGLRVSTAWDAASSQNHVTVAVDFMKLPSTCLYVFVGIVCPEGFAQPSRLELQARGVEAVRPGQANSKWTLGRRKIPELNGHAYTIAALVRSGAWWHHYALRAQCPGVKSKIELQQTWSAPPMVHFINRCDFPAHFPEKKRVVMRVVEGHDLAKKDFFGKADPFIVTTCGGPSEEYLCKEGTLNPSWKQHEGPPHTLTITASDPRRFEVHMFDRDNRKPDDFMGCCSVPVAHAFTLPTGTHYKNIKLEVMDAKVLAHILATQGNASWKRYSSTKVKGYVTIEIEVGPEKS